MNASTPPTIGFTRHFARGGPFWTIIEHGVRVGATEVGARLSMRYCNNDTEMAESIHSLIQQHVAAIIIAAMDPTFPPFLAALEQATLAGIPLIAIDVPIPYPVDCLVLSNDQRDSANAAAYLVERMGGRGKLIHLQGNMEAPVARLRSAGVHEVIDRYPDIEVIETALGRWSRDATLPLMRTLLAEHHDIAGVFAANDPMALGVIDALTEAGRLAGIPVIGVDGDPDALIAIEAGRMAATVQRSPYQIGRTAVEAAIGLINGQQVQREILIGDMTLVTAENVAREAINALKITPSMIDDLMESSARLIAERATLRTIIDNLPDVMYVKDRQGRFEVANQALAQMIGQASPEALLGKTDFDFFPPEIARAYAADEQAILESGVPLFDKEEAVPHADGTTHWLLTTKIPLHDPQGQMVGLVGRAQDVTDRKRAEIERQQLQEALIHAQAVALQELSTPLIPISDSILVMPLIGRIDARRASLILETLLTGIQTQQAELAIIDITGVNLVDTQVAHALLQAARAVQLLGARVVLTGLRPEVAQTLISLGVDMGNIVTRGTLQSGIAYGLQHT